jgi:flavin-dependent dehydrogenase
LIRNAARRNARVVEGCAALQVEFLPGDAGVRVAARHNDGSPETVHARFLLDASGRDTFLGNHLKAKRRNTKHNSAAIYAHFAGAKRHAGKSEGDISIFWFEHGWFWFIPLADGATSVGAVAWPYYLKTRKGKSLERFFEETIALCAPLRERLEAARLMSPVEVTGNYSYVCDRTHGGNYLLLGDAFAFIDPVFSSGVMLAMKSAFAAADTVDTSLRHPDRAAAASKAFDRLMRTGPEVYSWFIYRVTNPALRDMFMAPSNAFRAKEAFLSVVAGDIYDNTRARVPLLFFKAIYYATSLFSFRRTLKAWRTRRYNIRSVDDAGTMTG